MFASIAPEPAPSATASVRMNWMSAARAVAAASRRRPSMKATRLGTAAVAMTAVPVTRTIASISDKPVRRRRRACRASCPCEAL